MPRKAAGGAGRGRGVPARRMSRLPTGGPRAQGPPGSRREAFRRRRRPCAWVSRALPRTVRLVWCLRTGPTGREGLARGARLARAPAPCGGGASEGGGRRRAPSDSPVIHRPLGTEKPRTRWLHTAEGAGRGRRRRQAPEEPVCAVCEGSLCLSHVNVFVV